MPGWPANCYETSRHQSFGKKLAMNELSIKPGGSTGVVPQGHYGGNATAAGGFSVSFTNLLQQASVPVGIDFAALTDLAGNTADPNAAEPTAPAGDDGHDRFDDAGAGRSDDPPDAGRDAPDAGLRNDQVADLVPARPSGRRRDHLIFTPRFGAPSARGNVPMSLTEFKPYSLAVL